MGSDMIRPHIAVHSLVSACYREFVDVVETLMKCGVDANATDRVLVRSSKPSLHTNADCPALVAAVVSRQVSVVRHLLQVGIKTDINVRLGAWSWDTNTGEEFKVGAGLAEPYSIAWCAVEYFEDSCAILRMLLRHYSPSTLHFGRTLLHHVILCGNTKALNVLLDSGADMELPVKTTRGIEFRPIHMVCRLGLDKILQLLISSGCDLNSTTDSGETALMICARFKKEECFQVLASAGADFGIVNHAGQSVTTVAIASRWSLGFQSLVLSIIRYRNVVTSSNSSVFSPLMFVARTGDIEAMEALIKLPGVNIDEKDKNGFSPVMLTALEGHVAAFRLLLYAGADVTSISLSDLGGNHDFFEKVLLEFALEKGKSHDAGGFYVLHCAARRGDFNAVKLLTTRGYDVNVPDGDDYTPLMLAAKGNYGDICELLISCGARCDIKTANGETAISLCRKYHGVGCNTESVILDEISRVLVLNGARVQKHTKRGKGCPHKKIVRMVGVAGVLRWGKSSKRNVICREAEVGPSSAFQRNRRKKDDAYASGVFRVLTTKSKEFHFVCEGGVEAAELWVRGIRLVTREAIIGKKCAT